jgi:hypothetical protein
MLAAEIPSRYTDGDGVCPSDAVACELLVIEWLYALSKKGSRAITNNH